VGGWFVGGAGWGSVGGGGGGGPPPPPRDGISHKYPEAL
jgi:hypothetical protein